MRFTSWDWYKCLLEQFSKIVVDTLRIDKTLRDGKGASCASGMPSRLTSFLSFNVASSISSKRLKSDSQWWKSP